LIVNLNGGPTASLVDITVNANDGTTSFLNQVLKKNGDNFFTILASGGETMSSVSFVSDVGIGTFEQPRLSGIGGVIPEPSTWAMMLIGFAGLAYAGYRRAPQPTSIEV
jgi:PEP-CTERM motif